jgi:HD-like signal output (HDOD) protein
MLLWFGLAALSAVLFGASIFFLLRRRRSSESTSPQRDSQATVTQSAGFAAAPFQTDATTAIENALDKLAFGVARTDYRILGEHTRVLRMTQESTAGVMNEPRYFPRKPALLPKLMRAINTIEGGRNEIVRLILQDAVLAGNVLKRANSAYYRQGKELVESIDRAVTILGNEGLRAPVASAIMQPVFQLPAGFFEQFAPVTWERARRTAMAAEEFARVRNSADAFVAHLAGMLGSLSRIVLFRLTMDKYREQGNVMPRAEVFVRIMQDNCALVTRAIAGAWEMSPAFLEAFDAQVDALPPQTMTPLAATVYYANLCGGLATLHRHNLYSAEAARELMLAQGFGVDTFDSVWKAATDDELA